MTSVQELIPTHGAVAAYQVLGLPRGAPGQYLASQRRTTFVGPRQARRARPRPPMALDSQENQALLDTLSSERFVDILYRQSGPDIEVLVVAPHRRRPGYWLGRL